MIYMDAARDGSIPDLDYGWLDGVEAGSKTGWVPGGAAVFAADAAICQEYSTGVPWDRTTVNGIDVTYTSG
jgi:hypothetical protein